MLSGKEYVSVPWVVDRNKYCVLPEGGRSKLWDSLTPDFKW
jgi:hypothetical protein